MESSLKHNELTRQIIGTFFEVYNELGHGFLESVYHTAMLIALKASGHRVRSKPEIPVWFRGQSVGKFEADLIVDETVILELKSAQAIDRAHVAQLLNYLRATDIEVGLVLNFGVKPEFQRKAFDNSRKRFAPNRKSILEVVFEDSDRS